MFVIIGKHRDPEAAVAWALEPFWQDLEVDPYRDYLSASEIDRMAEHYGIPSSDLPALVAKMKDWRFHEGGVDERGLYALSTYNPDAKWDWYQIGGCFDGYIKGSRRNVISARSLRRSRHLRRHLPYYLLTPDERWLEQEGGPLFGHPVTTAQRRAERRWFATVRSALSRYIDCAVVCVDIHS